ncbi:lipopolysaccharide biosynthesis protein [Caballeronia hypogeia]|uniref:Lipopolysaccharide biosynthesis protein n=1 Tax=Caballeronia hypogeia TaxID=1777140 RepID=A0A158AF76_9BURK|nr:ABC transporter permease [Caballeronia hypogeia]SAK56502.1 lipopolysaccharide biosynthesis protein [Caballeronia hypogeia]
MIIKAIKGNRLFWGIVIVPMLLAIVYFGVVAKDRYVSTSEVVVQKVSSDGAASSASQIPGLAVLMGGGGLADGTAAETLYVREFITSQDMLDVLEEKLHWSRHYANHVADPWYHLSPGASKEELLKYFQKMVSAQFNETTGLLTVQVEAFDSDFAKKTLATVISESDRFVNDISHRLASEQVNFAEGELDRARRNYEERQDALLHFQGEHNVLDARQSAMAKNDVITGLQAELIKQNTSLRAMHAMLSDDSPQVRQQKIQIAALQQQIDAEEKKLVATNANNRMNVVASRYETLQLNAGIAQETYKASVASLQSARIDATRKLRSLVVVINPNMPDEALFPRRVYSLFTTLVILLLIFGVVHFVIATINDHKD